MRSLTVVAVLFCAPTVASAGVVISVENVSILSSPTTVMGSFEVYVASDLATPPDIFASQIRLSISGSGVKFTGVGKPTTHSYVFSPSTPSGAPVPGSAGTVLDGGDFLLTGVAPLKDGLGLLRVDYQVLGGTPVGSSFNIVVSTNIAETFLSKAAGNGPGISLPFTTKNGRINIVNTVPEPGTLAMIPAVVLGAGYYFWRRRLSACRRANSAGL